MPSRIAIDPIFESAGLVVIVGLVLLALLLVRPGFSGASASRRRWLRLLRIGAIALLCLAMLRPSWIRSERQEVTSTVAVLLDTSRSMQIEDVGDRSRYAAMQEAAERCLQLANRSRQPLDFEFYSFDVDLNPLTPEGEQLSLADQPLGKETDIGRALDRLLQQSQAKRLGAVILMSDGAVRTYRPVVDLRRVATELARQGTALFPITFGRSRDQSQARDVAITNLPDQFDVFAKNRIPIRASLKVSGYVGRSIPVSLEIESPDGEVQTVGPRTLAAGQDDDVLDVDFTYVPEQPGQYKLTVSAAAQDDEQVTDNNQMTAYLNVQEGGLRVLFLCGNLGWQEQKFLRRSLAASEDIDVDFRWIDMRRRANWPAEMDLKEASYDVILVEDVPAAAFGKPQCRILASWVREGKGLMMMGGKFSFGPGNYSETALSEVLPIGMSRFERQAFEADQRADVHVEGSVQLIPRRPHFVTTLNTTDNGAAWRALPPLKGANKFSKLSPSGRVLLESAEGAPMLVAAEYGLGRVLAFAGDSTYRWYRSGSQDAHKRFWRQVVLWLARKDDQGGQQIAIAMDQRRFPAGAEPTFAVTVSGDPSDAAVDAPQVEAFLVRPTDERFSVPLVQKADGTYSGSTEALGAPGEYKIEARLVFDEQVVSTANLPFQVIDSDIELTDPAANPNQMAMLAEITNDSGGRPAVPEDLGRVIADIEREAEGATIRVDSKWQLTDTPWDAWSVFLVMAALLSTEWFLRKKWHMV